jgi:hypothetical protein
MDRAELSHCTAPNPQPAFYGLPGGGSPALRPRVAYAASNEVGRLAQVTGFAYPAVHDCSRGSWA